MVVRAVPDLPIEFDVGVDVVVFPDVPATVVAVDANKRKVSTAGDQTFWVSVSALQHP